MDKLIIPQNQEHQPQMGSKYPLAAGQGSSCLKSQNFGRPRQMDHLRSGVQEQPGQHGETPSLLKIHNLAGPQEVEFAVG